MVIRINPSMTQKVIKLADLSPARQRLVIGATALVTHTSIDALNPFVDEDTRKYAAVRSAVKAIICTASGVMTREIGQRLGEYTVKTGKFAIPEGISKAAFTSSVGKVFAIAGAVVSIFCIDVPFINKLLNFTMQKISGKKPVNNQNESQNKGVNLNA